MVYLSVVVRIHHVQTPRDFLRPTWYSSIGHRNLLWITNVRSNNIDPKENAIRGKFCIVFILFPDCCYYILFAANNLRLMANTF